MGQSLLEVLMVALPASAKKKSRGVLIMSTELSGGLACGGEKIYVTTEKGKRIYAFDSKR